MKKVIVLFFLSFIALSAFTEEIMIYTGDGYVFNDILKGMVDRQFAIKYDTEEDIYYFFFADYMEKAWFHLNSSSMDTLRRTLDKYIEWEKIAIENLVEIEKQIPDSTLRGDITWKFADNWYFGKGFSLSFTFFSQSKSLHQLVISSNKIKATNNDYYDYQIEQLYMTKNQVLSFIDGVSTEYIAAIINEFSKNKDAESLFN